jgi:FKBP-type peptidyl-prolyl cis-trans isomerase 2
MIRLSGIGVARFGLLISVVAAFVIEKPRRLVLDRTCRRNTKLFSGATPEKGSVIEIDCTLLPERDFIPEPLFDGIVLDKSDPPRRLAFVLGEGNFLPGLHDLILGMEVGSEVENVSMDAGWGAWNPALNVSISFEALGGSGLDTSQIKVGTELMMANGMIAIVTQLEDEAFVVDANPPLAGASYLASVKLISAEPGPSGFVYAPDAGSGSKFQVATVALGCFWGGELAYMREPGVVGTKGEALQKRLMFSFCSLERIIPLTMIHSIFF